MWRCGDNEPSGPERHSRWTYRPNTSVARAGRLEGGDLLASGLGNGTSPAPKLKFCEIWHRADPTPLSSPRRA